MSENGIACDPSKIEAIINWPILINKTDVRLVLGLIGFYRRFISLFAETAKPLKRLTRKNVKLAWDGECEKAPVLSFPKGYGIFI